MAVKDSIRILLIGNGGREDALAWKLSQSSLVESIIAVCTIFLLQVTYTFNN